MTKISSQSPNIATQFTTPSQLQGPAQTESTQTISSVQDNQFEGGNAPTLNSITGGGDTPPQTTGGVTGGQSLLSLLLQGAPQNDGPGLFDLQPHTARHSVGLNTILETIPKTPEGQATIQKLLGDLQAQTGVALPPEVVAGILEDPTRLTDALQLDPATMSEGFKKLNAHHAVSGANAAQASEPTQALPTSVDLDNMDAIPYERPESNIQEMAPGLWRGSLPGDISDAQAKTNTVMANALDGLARNTDAADGEKFEVNYKGEKYDNIEGFMQALKNDGHEVEVVIQERVANFAELMTKGPDGQWMDVPTPLFVKTGITDENGQEATTPSIHSEMILRIRPGEGHQEGEGFTADVKWYQGVSRTGFYPVGIHATPEWCGGDERPLAKGDQAIEAVKLAGLFSDAVTDTAAEQGLARSGYGMTGVCNDSVAVIEHAMTGKTEAYPLLMQDDRLAPELNKRLSGADGSGYQRLLDTIEALPSDATPNETQRGRALNSIPWEPGQEPFFSTSAARDILQGQ